MKVYISPSDQWSNMTANNHSEAYHCSKIAEVVRRVLVANGHTAYIGDNSKEKTYMKRVKDSNSKNPDIHLAIHTNSGGGKGVEVWCHIGNHNNKYVKKVYEMLSELTPTNDRGIKETNHIYEINHTKALCVYLEVQFHDDKILENWIDTHIEEIGFSIAKGLCLANNGKFEKDTPKEKDILYRVCVGAYRNYDNAVLMTEHMKDLGVEAYIIKKEG